MGVIRNILIDPTLRRRIVRSAFAFCLPLGFIAMCESRHVTAEKIALPFAKIPTRGDRVLILAPHPDDEVISSGGLIQLALANGADVRAVVVTSGDGFGSVAHRLFPREPFAPPLFVKLGERRIEESRSAMRRLGLPLSHIRYWGYPDTGLERLWGDNWLRGHPFRNLRTRAIRSPYPGATPGSNYSGESLLRDLEALFRTYQPTYLVYPHPGDCNRDHRSLAAFALLALDRLSHNQRWRHPKEEAAYLVHWGVNWPWPKRSVLDQELVPPASFLTARQDWKAIYFESEAETKEAALREYQSQFASPFETRLLSSFMRRSEPFSFARRSRPLADGETLIEPVDSGRIVPGYSAANDVTEIRIQANAEKVKAVWKTATLPNPRIIRRIEMRTLDPAGRTTWIADQWPPAKNGRVLGAWSASGTTISWSLPRRYYGDARWAFVSAAMIDQRREMDRTAWTAWSLKTENKSEMRSASRPLRLLKRNIAKKAG